MDDYFQELMDAQIKDLLTKPEIVAMLAEEYGLEPVPEPQQPIKQMDDDFIEEWDLETSFVPQTSDYEIVFMDNKLSYVEYNADRIKRAQDFADAMPIEPGNETSFDKVTQTVVHKPRRSRSITAFAKQVQKAVDTIYNREHFDTLQQYISAVRDTFTVEGNRTSWLNPKAPKLLAFRTHAQRGIGSGVLITDNVPVMLTLNPASVLSADGEQAIWVSLLSTAPVQLQACERFRQKMQLPNKAIIEFVGVSMSNNLAVFRQSDNYYESNCRDVVRPVRIEPMEWQYFAQVVYRECQELVVRNPKATDANVAEHIDRQFALYRDLGVFTQDDALLKLSIKNSDLFGAARLKGIAATKSTGIDPVTKATPLIIESQWFYDAEFRMLVCQHMRYNVKDGIGNNQIARYEQFMQNKFGCPVTYRGNAYYYRVDGYVPIFHPTHDITKSYAYNPYTQGFAEVMVSPNESLGEYSRNQREAIARTSVILAKSLSKKVKLSKAKITFELPIEGDDITKRPSLRVGLRHYNNQSHLLVLYFNQFLGTDFIKYYGNTKEGQFIFGKTDSHYYVYEGGGVYTPVTFEDNHDSYGSFF